MKASIGKWADDRDAEDMRKSLDTHTRACAGFD
jgi:hypothetical protein